MKMCRNIVWYFNFFFLLSRLMMVIRGSSGKTKKNEWCHYNLIMRDSKVIKHKTNTSKSCENLEKFQRNKKHIDFFLEHTVCLDHLRTHQDHLWWWMYVSSVKHVNINKCFCHCFCGHRTLKYSAQTDSSIKTWKLLRKRAPTRIPRMENCWKVAKTLLVFCFCFSHSFYCMCFDSPMLSSYIKQGWQIDCTLSTSRTGKQL